MTNWTLAARAAKMNPSAIREILKLTDKPGIISLAGGLPSPKAFPLQEFTAACNTVMARDGAAALQYATSEGFAPLRQAVADMLPWAVDPDQVLITTGSQQALDLIGKVFLDKDSRMLVETPTYLGALQAFAPQEPLAVSVASDDDGILVDDFAAKVGTGADKARLAYVLPNFQNPTGRTMTEARRAALVAKAALEPLVAALGGVLDDGAAGGGGHDVDAAPVRRGAGALDEAGLLEAVDGARHGRRAHLLVGGELARRQRAVEAHGREHGELCLGDGGVALRAQSAREPEHRHAHLGGEVGVGQCSGQAIPLGPHEWAAAVRSHRYRS